MIEPMSAADFEPKPRRDFACTLQAIGVAKAFAAGALKVTVLRSLAIAIRPGELTLISGPSGCGKSTLLSILSGLIPPDTGAVTALGQDLGALDRRGLERFRLRHTGFVFQGFNLFAALTALEQVQLPLGYLGLSDRTALQRAKDALDEVGMSHRLRSRPAELSGGERQRVAIARAIAKHPRLLFADEPTSALDAANGQLVIDMLHRIARTHDATVLCVSHDPRVVDHADRVLAMEDGVIREDRTSPTGVSARQLLDALP